MIDRRQHEARPAAGRDPKLAQVRQGEPLDALRAIDDVASGLDVVADVPEEPDSISIDHGPSPGFRRGDLDALRRWRWLWSVGVTSNVGDAPREARVRGPLLGMRRPASWQVIDRVRLCQSADERVWVLTQFDRPQIGLGL